MHDTASRKICVRSESMYALKARALWALLVLGTCMRSAAPHVPSAPAFMHGKARLSEQGPDIAMLHPPDGFLVEDASKLMVAFYVSSFCVSRLGEDLEVCLRIHLAHPPLFESSDLCIPEPASFACRLAAACLCSTCGPLFFYVWRDHFADRG